MRAHDIDSSFFFLRVVYYQPHIRPKHTIPLNAPPSFSCKRQTAARRCGDDAKRKTCICTTTHAFTYVRLLPY